MKTKKAKQTEKEEIQVEVTRKQVKYCTIRIRRDRTVAVTVPLHMKEEDWRAFFEKKKPWIEKHLNAMPQQPKHNYDGEDWHYLLGQKVKLLLCPGFVDGARMEGNVVQITYKHWNTKPETLVARYWSGTLADVIQKLIDKWVPIMKVEPAGFQINRTKSRWGSCNVKTGELKFTLELSAKPYECIESVVVHELNHLLEPSHNDRFHKLMDHWLPDWKERKKQLNTFPREFY